MNKIRTWAVAPILVLALGGCERAEPQTPAQPDPPLNEPAQPDAPGETGEIEEDASPMIDDSAAHEWPPVSIDRAGETLAIVLQAPNPGWSITVDGEEALPAGSRVLVSLVRPAPGQLFPQVITDMRAECSISAAEPAEVFARVITEGEDEAGAYRRVTDR